MLYRHILTRLSEDQDLENSRKLKFDIVIGKFIYIIICVNIFFPDMGVTVISSRNIPR